MMSLQSDLLPLLVHRQFRGASATFGAEHDLTEALEQSQRSHEQQASFLSQFAVNARVFEGGALLRVSNVAAYLFASREFLSGLADHTFSEDSIFALPRGAKFDAKLHNVVMEAVTMGDKVQCKYSTIGAGSKLGAKCRLNNVIVMNGVTVGENCVIQNSILASNCTIGENCNLNDCQVPAGKHVPPATREKGESFVDGL